MPLRVLVLEGATDFATDVVRALSLPGSAVVHVLAGRSTARARFSRHVASFRHIRSTEHRELFRVVREQCQRYAIDVVLPVDETAIRWVSFQRRHWGELPLAAATPPVDLLDRLVDKWAAARLFEAHGIPHPRTTLFGGQLSLESFPFPAVLKPRLGSGGVGIVYLPDRPAALRFAQRHPWETGTYILQEYVFGADFGAAALRTRGAVQAITVQRTLSRRPQPFGPSERVAVIDDPRVRTLMEGMLEAIGFDGIAQADLRRDSDGRLFVLEVNPRYWASVLASVSAGANFPFLACLDAVGQTVRRPVVRPLISTSAREALWQAFARRRNRRSRIDWRDSRLPYVLRDPLPFAISVAARLSSWRPSGTPALPPSGSLGASARR